MSHSDRPFTKIHRIAATLLAAILVPLLGGWTQGPQSTFDTKGPVALSQLNLFYVTLWVTGIIFVLVAGVLTYATLKFKARTSADEHAEPPAQSHGNPLIELSLIAASVLALVVIAIPTLKAIWYTHDIPEDQQHLAYEVTATGYQWWFKFDYPAEQIDGVGTLSTANELVIPAGRPVRVNLRTVDVIHSFWVPKLAGKVDMIPNRGNFLWLQADEPGYFWGQCAEFCGESHAVMRFRVIALGEEDFANWVAAQKAAARTVDAPPPGTPIGTQLVSYEPMRPNAPGWTPEFDADPLASWTQLQEPADNEDAALIARGRQHFQEKACITCHTVRGHEGVGITGPELTHFGSRSTLAAGLLENTPRNLHRWLTAPNEVKPGNLMWFGRAMPGYMVRNAETGEWEQNFTVNDEEGHALVAYLNSLK